MVRIYDYIYFRVYKIIKQINDEAPEFVSIIAFSLFVIVKTGVIFNVVIYFFQDLEEYSSKLIGGLIGVAIIAFNFIYFLYDNHYLKIIERLDKNDKQSLRKSIAVIAYFILMLVVFVFILENKS